MKNKTLIFSLLLVTLLTACSGAPTTIHIDFPTIEPDATATPTTTPESTATQPTKPSSPTKTPTPTHWPDIEGCEAQTIEPSSSEGELLVFESEELGVEFKYPPPVGNYRYEYACLVCSSPNWDGWPAVSSIFWTIDAFSLSNEGHYRAFFASALTSGSNGLGSGSPVDAIRFRRTQGAYYLDFADGREFEVEPLKIIKHPDGVYALVYNPRTSLGPAWPDELVVVIMLPEGLRSEFESINIHLFEEHTLKFVEQLVYSVRFLDFMDFLDKETPEPD
jgi:hypothetical protein